MVNGILLEPSPERELALSYAPARARDAMRALLMLDDRFGRIVRAGREPMLAQVRVTWWFEALERLDCDPPPAEPVLRALAADVLPHGVSGATLAAMVDGWEAILGDAALTDERLALFAEGRGARLFGAIASVCGAGDPQVRLAGEGWALADLAFNLSDHTEAARVRAVAAPRLREATALRWSRAGRGLGALALLARFGVEGEGGGASRITRLLWHRVTGR